VAEGVEGEAKRTIQTLGLHLAPGFIDPHTHSEFTLLADPRAESKIRQGVTTEVIGNCGFSPAPLLGAAVEETQAEAKGVGVRHRCERGALGRPQHGAGIGPGLR
jgi:N-acyl-D-aspartate/D-glutamate deacylase